MTAADLLEQMKRLELDEREAMLTLNDAGLISDNCTHVWDIAEPDLSRAVQWLRARRIRYGSKTDVNEKVLI